MPSGQDKTGQDKPDFAGAATTETRQHRVAEERPSRPLRVLFASSEAFPLIKTGGLADVSHALPNALAALGVDVRVVLPAYRSVMAQVSGLKLLGWQKVSPNGDVRIWQAQHSAFNLPIYLVDQAALFDREGNPYTHPDGHDWPDNPFRFAVFSRAAALLAVDALETGWRPDVLHANDWQTGLAMGCITQTARAPKTVYTIHNLAYDCQFDYAEFQHLRLPPHWWSMEHAEFFGRFSMMKAGLVFADRVTTVSPTYADEICTPEYGYGYAGILQSNRDKLSGIINGIDTAIWNPATDAHLESHFCADDDDLIERRAINRRALLSRLLEQQPDQAATLKSAGGKAENLLTSAEPVIGFVGRLVYQKGVDLLLDAIPKVLDKAKARFVIVGSGEQMLEQQLVEMTRAYPGHVLSFIGYSEPLAHLVEGGCDMFAMPSRYEPCGLNQLYSLRYGCPPIVRKTGGLADTVVDTHDQTFADGTASGFVFEEPTADALATAILRAIAWRQQDAPDAAQVSRRWQAIMRNGMTQDLDWKASAARYLALYRDA